jgi:predicted AAA+ superfamily ATPase
MADIKRHAEQTVRELTAMFGAVLVTGSRQVGKTTLLKQVTATTPGVPIQYISLDNAAAYQSAREEGETFFEYNKPPVFVDEIQYAPNLFPSMREIRKAAFSKPFLPVKGDDLIIPLKLV